MDMRPQNVDPFKPITPWWIVDRSVRRVSMTFQIWRYNVLIKPIMKARKDRNLKPFFTFEFCFPNTPEIQRLEDLTLQYDELSDAVRKVVNTYNGVRGFGDEADNIATSIGKTIMAYRSFEELSKR